MIDTSKINSVNRAVYNVLLKLAIASAVAANPILAEPVLNFIFRKLVTLFADAFFLVADRFIVFSAIGFDNENLDSEYQTEVSNLRKVLSNPEATPEEVERASQKFDEKLSKLIPMSKSSR